jgi:hypothetical protein
MPEQPALQSPFCELAFRPLWNLGQIQADLTEILFEVSFPIDRGMRVASCHRRHDVCVSRRRPSGPTRDGLHY